MAKRKSARRLCKGVATHDRNARYVQDCVRVPRAEYDALMRKVVTYEIACGIVDGFTSDFADARPLRQMIAAAGRREG